MGEKPMDENPVEGDRADKPVVRVRNLVKRFQRADGSVVSM